MNATNRTMELLVALFDKAMECVADDILENGRRQRSECVNEMRAKLTQHLTVESIVADAGIPAELVKSSIFNAKAILEQFPFDTEAIRKYAKAGGPLIGYNILTVWSANRLNYGAAPLPSPEGEGE